MAMPKSSCPVPATINAAHSCPGQCSEGDCKRLGQTRSNDGVTGTPAASKPGGQRGADYCPYSGAPHDQAQPQGTQSEVIQNHGWQDRPEDGGADEPDVAAPRHRRQVGVAIYPSQALRDLVVESLFAA